LRIMWVIAGLVLALAAGTAGAAPHRPAAPETLSSTANEQAVRAYAQGRLLEFRGDYRGALGEYVRALALDRESIAIPRHIAELVARMGDASGSLQFADRALGLDSTDTRSLWIKGTALLGTGHPVEALPLLEACVDQDSMQIEYVQA